MHYTKKYLLALMMICSFTSFSQKDKGDAYYEKLNYGKAIPAYEKAIKSNPKDQDALIKLADCYQTLNNYPKAEICYKQAIDLGKAPAITYYKYGNILKCNNKHNEALNQYFAYLESDPKDEKILRNTIKSCQEIKYWESKPKEYDVKNLDHINTISAEFSPVLFNNKLVFVGERVTDLVDFEKSAINNKPYLNVFTSELNNNEFSKVKSFSSQVNTTYHDGPICFTKDGKTAYFTRVSNIVDKKDKSFVNRTKILITNQSGKKWSKPTSFTYNSDSYSCAHPSISQDGNYLYFSSDMPGGMGGQDLWVSKRNGDTWEKPVNMGIDINTSGDELFPYIKNDTVIYFSSNGLPGFGDLDIFSGKKINGRWLLRRNEGFYINSTADDFGMAFTNDSMGYFSSNRLGGKGSDDLYSFKFTSKEVKVEGTVLLKDDLSQIAKNLKIYLLNDKKKIIDSTYTDNRGYFAFRDLDFDKTYMAEVAETEGNLKNKSRYFMADKNDRIARVTHNEGPNNKFVFRNLPIDLKGLPELYDESDISLAGNLLFGGNGSQSPIANKKVTISNSFGDVVEETTTNEFGAFAFRDLPFDQNYTLSVDESEIPLEAKIFLINKKGKEVKVVRSRNPSDFAYKPLNINKSTLQDLEYTDENMVSKLGGKILYGNQNLLPLANKKVIIKSADGKILQEAITNETGSFDFKPLSFDKNSLLIVDESDVPLNARIILVNKKGVEIKVLREGFNQGFDFKLLNTDKSALSDLAVSDADLIMTLRGFLLDQDKKALDNAKLSLFSEAKLVEVITTDKAGKFDFRSLKTDKNYLFDLDETDARFKTISKLYIADSKGRIFREINRIGDGKFSFELLEIDKNLLGDFSIDDPWMEELVMKNKDRSLKPKEVKEKPVETKTVKLPKEKPEKTNPSETLNTEVVYAGYNAYQLDDNGKKVLDKLAAELKSKTNLKLEIISHADSRGSNSYNMALSQKRSKAAVDYLVSKGIDQSRLKGIGYGETKLINTCDDENTCSEEDHAKNRRIEFKLIEIK